MGDVTKLWLEVHYLVLKYLVELHGVWGVSGQTQLARTHKDHVGRSHVTCEVQFCRGVRTLLAVHFRGLIEEAVASWNALHFSDTIQNFNRKILSIINRFSIQSSTGVHS